MDSGTDARCKALLGINPVPTAGYRGRAREEQNRNIIKSGLKRNIS
jgi:hypothetical protein